MCLIASHPSSLGYCWISRHFPLTAAVVICDYVLPMGSQAPSQPSQQSKISSDTGLVIFSCCYRASFPCFTGSLEMPSSNLFTFKTIYNGLTFCILSYILSINPSYGFGTNLTVQGNANYYQRGHNLQFCSTLLFLSCFQLGTVKKMISLT